MRPEKVANVFVTILFKIVDYLRVGCLTHIFLLARWHTDTQRIKCVYYGLLSFDYKLCYLVISHDVLVRKRITGRLRMYYRYIACDLLQGSFDSRRMFGFKPCDVQRQMRKDFAIFQYK